MSHAPACFRAAKELVSGSRVSLTREKVPGGGGGS